MKKILFILLTMVTVLHGKAQDLTFSQFYEKPLLRNPALAGIFEGDIRVSGIFRNQWQSVTVPFQTGAASVEVKFPFNKWNDWLTIGLQLAHDVAGDVKLKRTQILPVLNYHKALSADKDDFISVAFMAGPVNSQFDPTQLKLNDQFINGSFNPNNPTQQIFSRTGFTYWDAATGITYSSGYGNNSRFYVGAALFHFNKPKVSFYVDNGSSTSLSNKWVFNAGLSTATSDNNHINFFADYFMQGGNSQFLGGVLYGTDLVTNYDDELKTTLYIGGFYRWNDAFVPVVKLNMFNFNVGISYDVNVSKLQTASSWRGGLELSMSYTMKLRNRSYDASFVRCPRF